MTESESNGHLHPCRYTADEIFEVIKKGATSDDEVPKLPLGEIKDIVDTLFHDPWSQEMVVTVVGKDYMGEILHCSACGHEWYKGMNESDECDWCNESRETNALTRWRNSTATDGEVKS